MDEEGRISTPRLFASWAQEDFASWHRAIGATVTHLSRGDGRIVNVSQAGSIISIHVQYAGAGREHALWEFRTELTHMTLADGMTRNDLIPVVKARRLLQEQQKKANRAALSAKRREE
jgi:hypothetical protein